LPSQKAPKPTKELTSEEALKRLFHPKVVEHAKRHVREANAPKKKSIDAE